MNDFRQDVAPLIKQMIKNKGMSLETFSLYSGLRVSALKKLVYGHHVPKADLFIKVLKKLDLDIFTLIERAHQMSKLEASRESVRSISP